MKDTERDQRMTDKTYDKLDLVIFRNIEEDWVEEWGSRTKFTYSMKILINGKDLAELAKEEEGRKRGRGFRYGHAEASWILRQLKGADEGGSDFDPLCCPSCGEPACCTFWGRTYSDPDAVRWTEFVSRSCTYDFDFRFEKEEYDRKITDAERRLGEFEETNRDHEREIEALWEKKKRRKAWAKRIERRNK